jgi:L-alanine-DL-glutamate epimerase-like enolase superfamily enzyme
MRISSVSLHHLRIPLRVPFAHALKARNETETVIVVVTSSDGISGVGEILPRPYLTGETINSVLQSELPPLVQSWLGRSFEHRAGVVAALEQGLRDAGRALATFAGWEMALLDLTGKTFGFSAGDVLGPVLKSDLDTGVVIDFAVSTNALAKRCRLLRIAGRRHIKVKVGQDSDLQRLAIIAGVLGGDFPLRIDANGAWHREQAVAALQRMREFNITSVEQPVPATDLDGMRHVRKETGLAIVADESLCSFSDGERLIQMGGADCFNIRIAKCGGLLACLRLAKLAFDAGLHCQLGTLVGETGILARAAELLGTRVPGFEFLEGRGQNKRLLREDVVEQPLQGEVAASHGLGIRLVADSLRQRAASPAITFKSSKGAKA